MVTLKRVVTENGMLIATVVLIFLLIVSPVFEGQVYAEYDLREQFIPWRIFYSLSLEQNELGLWNPFLCRGYNHHGEGQSGLLHPFHLLLYKFLPVHYAIPIELTFYFPFAFFGMVLLLKSSFRLSSQAAIFGAGVFSFSTFYYAHFPHVNLLWIYSHLPWLVYAMERCFRRRGQYYYAGILAICFASILLLGHPQMVWINLLTMALVLIYLGCKEENPREFYKTGLVPVITAMISGSLIGLLQVLPSASYFLRSARRSLSEVELDNFSLHPLNLLINFSSFFFIDKSVGDFVYHSPTDYTFLNSHQEFPSYLGLGVLTLICAGLVAFREHLFSKGRIKVTIIVAAMLALTVLLSFGKYGGLTSLTRLIPFVSKFRCPARYIAMSMFLLSIVGAVAVHGFETCHTNRWRSFRGRMVLPVPFAISVAVMLYGIATPYIPFKGARLYTGSFWQLLVAPAISLLALALIVLHSRGKPYALSLMCCLCLMDVTAYGAPILFRSELRSLAQIETAKKKMKTEDHRFRHVSKLNEPLWQGAYLASGYLGIPPPTVLNLFENSEHLRLASVRYAHGTTRLFSVKDSLPRIRLARELRHSENWMNDLPSINLEDVALCRPDVASEITGPPLTPNERVTFIEDGYSRLRLKVHVESRRVLVLSDRWSEGWQADVDGEKRSILPLFGKTMRGIMVDKGAHVVSMTFQPPLFKWGSGAAIIGVLMVSGLFVKHYHSRPRE